MTRSKKKLLVKSETEQQEVLNSKVRSDGKGEDPAMEALLSGKFAEMPNSEASQIAIWLQELIRGQKVVGEELSAIREHMNKIDEDAARWELDRKKWLEEVNSKSESLLIADPDKKAKFEAEFMLQFQKKIEQAKAEGHTNLMKWHIQIDSEPKVSITSPGKLEILNGISTISPEVIKIRDREWVLKPGVATLVPRSIADFYEKKKIHAQYAKEKAAIFQPNSEGSFKKDVTIAQQVQAVDEKYHKGGERFPIGSRA